MNTHFSTLNLTLLVFWMEQSWQKWQPNHLCTSYFLSGPRQLKSAWMLWCQPCGIDSSLIRILDKTTGWTKYFPGCPIGQNWQLCSSVHTILTRSPTAFLPETKCGYHHLISIVISTLSHTQSVPKHPCNYLMV